MKTIQKSLESVTKKLTHTSLWAKFFAVSSLSVLMLASCGSKDKTDAPATAPAVITPAPVDDKNLTDPVTSENVVVNSLDTLQEAIKANKFAAYTEGQSFLISYNCRYTTQSTKNLVDWWVINLNSTSVKTSVDQKTVARQMFGDSLDHRLGSTLEELKSGLVAALSQNGARYEQIGSIHRVTFSNRSVVEFDLNYPLIAQPVSYILVNKNGLEVTSYQLNRTSYYTYNSMPISTNINGNPELKNEEMLTCDK